MHDADRARDCGRNPKLQSEGERDVQVQAVREGQIDAPPQAELGDRVLEAVNRVMEPAEGSAPAEHFHEPLPLASCLAGSSSLEGMTLGNHRCTPSKKPGSASNSRVWETLTLPSKIRSAAEFEESVLAIRQAYTGSRGDRWFLDLMYYLLGWLVGDAGKNFSSEHPWARIEIGLSKKHPQNLGLGNFVMSCISLLGMTCGRIKDGSPRASNPYGSYRWMSYFSEVVFWFHTACLGLSENQLTSYDPVSMDWLLTATRASIEWFLRGIADSDGCVNVNNRAVEITSEPNGPLFVKLFAKVGIRAKISKSKGYDSVSISAFEAARIQIFNSQVGTYRSELLDRLVNAHTFPARWPAWLEERVHHLLSEHGNLSTVRNILLSEDNTYVKLRSLRNKAIVMGSRRRALPP